MSAGSATATLRLGIVLFRNSEAELVRLADSLEAARAQPETPPFEVSWLDNSPDRGLEQVVAGLGTGGRYRHSGTNLGFGAGHNRLLADAFADPSVDCYVCVNPDAVLHPLCLAELLVEVKRHRKPGLVEALQFPDEHPKPYDVRTHETPWCSGCLLLVTRQLFEDIGGFDERFFMYCEDVDLSWRARAAGFSVAIAPRALVQHYVGDRPPGSHVAAMMLESGAYLGAKYGNASFAQRCIEEHHRRTASWKLAMPQVEPPTEAMKLVAEFGHMFHFAEVRW